MRCGRLGRSRKLYSDYNTACGVENLAEVENYIVASLDSTQYRYNNQKLLSHQIKTDPNFDIK